MTSLMMLWKIIIFIVYRRKMNEINVGHCVVSVLLRFTGSDCPLGIFKLLLYEKYILGIHIVFFKLLDLIICIYNTLN